MESFFTSIDKIIEKLRAILVSDKPILDDVFFPLVGDYSKGLKQILEAYHEPSRTKGDKNFMAPYINYYRQLQNYLIFICRFPTILLVPKHSEILQTLNFIDQKEKLLKELYESLSKQEKALFNSPFKDELEYLIGKTKWILL